MSHTPFLVVARERLEPVGAQKNGCVPYGSLAQAKDAGQDGSSAG